DLTALSVEELVEGELLVTELMYDPRSVDDGVGEWIEVYNNSGENVDLSGLVFSDGEGTDTIDLSIEIEDGEYALFCIDADSTVNGGLSCDFEYTSSIAMSNSGDQMTLSNKTLTIDTVDYDASGFDDPSGASISLDPDFYDFKSNDSGTSWCPASTVYSTSYDKKGAIDEEDEGTPGTANDECSG
ncbi:MAG: hypothetical protein ACI8S6_001705, partial [Myxococcota bacterium]